MDAILIAGGRAHAPLSEVAGHSVKGLFILHGATLITRVLHALQQAGVRRIAVVGSELLLHALPSLDAEILFAVEAAILSTTCCAGWSGLGCLRRRSSCTARWTCQC